MKNILLILSLFTIFVACATPTVINIIVPNDGALNCKELSSEIAKANKYANDAQSDKKKGKPHNIGEVRKISLKNKTSAIDRISSKSILIGGKKVEILKKIGKEKREGHKTISRVRKY